MGAETKVYVKVVKEVTSWVEVDAVTKGEAIDKVFAMDQDIVRVIDVLYEPPYSESEVGHNAELRREP